MEGCLFSIINMLVDSYGYALFCMGVKFIRISRFKIAEIF